MDLERTLYALLSSLRLCCSPKSLTVFSCRFVPKQTKSCRCAHFSLFLLSWSLKFPPKDIADYVHSYKIDSDLALATARLCLIGASPGRRAGPSSALTSLPLPEPFFRHHRMWSRGT